LETDLPETDYKVFIPRTFAQRIKELGPGSALWKQFVPRQNECDSFGLFDPIGDETYSKGSGVIHRYSNRVLFSPTTVCPINCRYCFRKNELNNNVSYLKKNLENAVAYVKAYSEVEEVILTGGDPLMLSNQELEKIITKFMSIDHVQYIRLHTRFPIIIPSRIDDGFIEMTKRYPKIVMAIHSNHVEEFSHEFQEKMKSLEITLLSQSVLLEGINNHPELLAKLMRKFHECNIRPYYLHHPDQVQGAMHFNLTLKEGRQIYRQLRQQLPGWLIPHYIVDIPGGFGKTLAYNSEHDEFSGSFISAKGQRVQQDPNFIL
jgi:lysine 2,3-aminomutase